MSKRTLALILSIILAFSAMTFTSFADGSDVAAVIGAIDAIGKVTCNFPDGGDSLAAIESAQALYDALNEAEKAQVTNAEVLADAQSAYWNAAYKSGRAAYSASGFTGTFAKDNCMSQFITLDENTNDDWLISCGSTVTLKARIRDVEKDDLAFFGLFTFTFSLGYDFANQRFGIMSTGFLFDKGMFVPEYQSKHIVLDPNVFYEFRFEAENDHTAIYLDGECMVSTSGVHWDGESYLIFDPRCLSADFVLFRWEMYGVNILGADFTGSDLLTCPYWYREESGYGKTPGTFTGETVVGTRNDANVYSEAAQAAWDNASKHVSAFMGASADSSQVCADFYFKLPNEDDPRNFDLTFNGADRGFAELTREAPGYKVSVTVPAKKMGDALGYSVRYRVPGGGTETVLDGVTSVKAYASYIAASPSEYAALARAMLVYGAAAQRYFDYDTDHPVSAAAAGDSVPENRFDYGSLRSDLSSNGSIPVNYTAMNVTFLSDTTLSIAFSVVSGGIEDAEAWVEQNVTLGGAPVDAVAVSSNGYSFIIIRVQNVGIDKVFDPIALEIAGVGTYQISVLNYLSAAEANGSDELRDLARALYAYAAAVAELNSNVNNP